MSEITAQPCDPAMPTADSLGGGRAEAAARQPPYTPSLVGASSKTLLEYCLPHTSVLFEPLTLLAFKNTARCPQLLAQRHLLVQPPQEVPARPLQVAQPPLAVLAREGPCPQSLPPLVLDPPPLVLVGMGLELGRLAQQHQVCVQNSPFFSHCWGHPFFGRANRGRGMGPAHSTPIPLPTLAHFSPSTLAFCLMPHSPPTPHAPLSFLLFSFSSSILPSSNLLLCCYPAVHSELSTPSQWHGHARGGCHSPWLPRARPG